MEDKFYRNLIKSAPFGYACHKIILSDTGKPIDYEFIETNTAFEKITGIQSMEILNRRATEVIPNHTKGDSDRFALYAVIAIHGGEREFEHYSESLKRWYSVQVYSPEKYYFSTLFSDITERKNAEETLRNEHKLFRTIIDLIPDAVYVKDTDGRKIFANPKEVQFSGMNSEGDIIGKTDFNLYPENDAMRSEDEDYFVLQSGKPILDIEGTLVDRKGNLLRLLGSKVPLRDIRGKVTGLVGVTHDITARKRAEEKLQESEANFRTFFESMDDMIFIANPKGEIFFINHSVTRKLGYTFDEIQGMQVLEVYPVKKRMEAKQIFEGMSSGKRNSNPLPLIRKDGTSVPVETFVWFGQWDGKEAIFGLAKDLSKEQESLQKFNKIFDNNPALMTISSLNGRIFTEVNHAFLAKTGYSRDEVIGKSAKEIGLFIQDEIQDEIAAEIARNGTIPNRELQIKTRNGDILDGLFSGEIIENYDVKYFLSVMLDVTESKKMEMNIKLQNDFYNIASKVSERLIQTDSDRLDSEINHALEMLGLFNKVDRTYIFDLDPVTDEINNTYEWCATGISPEIDNLQGIPFSSLARWKETFLRNEHIYIESVSDLPNEFQFEKEILVPLGIQSLVCVPMYYGQSLIGLIGFDSVTNKKQWSEQVIILLKVLANVLAGVIYKKKTEAALSRAKHEADSASKAKSEFLANMSHEIRTPLNGIIGFTELLLKTPLNKIQQQYAENVNISGFSLLGIISDILDFSKIEAGKMDLDPIKTDLIELVEQASDIIKYHASKKGLELLLNIQSGIPRFALVDPVRLKQILINLLGNAVKFTESGEVELKLTFTPKDEMSGLFNFSVRDTGIGISKAQQLKLFKAFSQADTSTTRKFGGTGLGLTISNMIAEKMGSKIELLSEPDLGANFYFTLETGYEYGENTDSGSLSDIKRVLVIDDNENNRIILEHTFKYWDVECVATDNGLSGLKLIEQSKPFDVVIIDYHMPYLNGIDTIKMIRGQLKLSPEILPIILLHSSADDMKIYDECKKLGVRFNLTKPVKSQELLHYLKNTNTLPEKNKKALSKNSLFQKSFQNAPVILVAEDVVINMLLITTVIRQMVPNAEILEAKNGKEAFEIMTKQRPALIFMDLQMPEMDGIEATQEIRNFEKGIGSHIPIIALTAGAIKGEEEKCRNAGMDDFITKPIAQIKLYEILKRYLSIAPTEKEKIAEHELLLHFDKTVLEQRIGNNAEIWKELTGSVLIEIPMYFESLRHAINQENRVEIQKINHTIKGISLNMCFDRLAGLAKKIELILTNNGPGKPDVIFKQMVLEWEQIESIIKEPEMQ